MRLRLYAALLGLFASLGVLLWGACALAQEAPSEMLPRDVNVLVRPAAAELPPLPGDFETTERGWLIVAAPASVRERVEPLVRDAGEVRERLSAELGEHVLDHVVVRVARTPEQMAALAPVGAPPFSYATAMAYPGIDLVLISLKEPDSWEAPDLSEVLAHELSHIALSDAVSDHHVPRWFNEGLAIRESGEFPWARRKTLLDASLSRQLLPLTDLDRGFPNERYQVNIAYAESADFVGFLMRDSDRARFGSVIQRVRAGVDFDRALEDAYGTTLRKLEYEWREDVGRRYGLVPALTGGGLVWVFIFGLAGVAWLKKRRRAKAKLEQWAREDREIDAAIAARRAESVTTGEEELPHVPSVTVVEHEGRWYTLH
jgi:hypothetical protein